MARFRSTRAIAATAELYIDISEHCDICSELETTIIVDFDYTRGQAQTYWEPGYGPEVTDWSWRIEGAEDVPLPMVVHAAIESFVADHMQNDPQGWVERAIERAEG